MPNSKFKKLLLVALPLILAGCSTVPVEQVNNRLAAWKGQHIDQVIKYWGLPSKQRQVGQKHYAEWINKSSEPGNAAISIGTGTRSRHSGIGIGFTLFDIGSTDDACSRLVTYEDNGMVSEISWQGTNDFCFKITPDLGDIRKNKAVMEKKG